MKFLTHLLGLSLVLAAAPFSAAASGAEIAKANCSRCHALDKDGKGPSVKQIAEKYKGREADAAQAVKDAKAGHPKVKGSAADLSAAIGWMLSN